MASVSASDVPAGEHHNLKRNNQYIGALVASLGGFSLGVSLAWNSSAGDTLRNVLQASATEIGLSGVVLNVGACCGFLMLPWIQRFLSGTGTMVASIPINIVGWAFICFADQKVWLLIIGRTICGLASGIFCVLTPLYISEISDKTTRARLLTFFQLFVNCGVMSAFFVAHILNEREAIWRYSLVCAAATAPIALVIFLPESPLYHLSRGNVNGAISSLKWYRGDEYKYKSELEELSKLAKLRKANFKAIIEIMLNRKVLWSLVICHGVIIAQQLTGINTLIFYALTIFNHGGSGHLTGEELVLVVGALQILSCLLCTLTINHLGRKVLLTISAALTGFFLILLGWYFNVRDDDPELYDDTYGWMPPTWISLFFVAFNLGLGPISWSMLSDTFPMEIRVSAASSAAFLSWLISLITTMTFGEMATALGIPKTMWLFAGFTWMATIFCAIFVQDNTKKSLFDIQKDFGTEMRISESESESF